MFSLIPRSLHLPLSSFLIEETLLYSWKEGLWCVVLISATVMSKNLVSLDGGKEPLGMFKGAKFGLYNIYPTATKSIWIVFDRWWTNRLNECHYNFRLCDSLRSWGSLSTQSLGSKFTGHLAYVPSCMSRILSLLKTAVLKIKKSVWPQYHIS